MNSKAEYNQPEIRLLQKATQRRKNSKASWSKTTLQQTKIERQYQHQPPIYYLGLVSRQRFHSS
jgi:hypothetical protein